MTNYLLGIDIGTTGAKALLVDENGRRIAYDYEPYGTSTPRPGWCEQDAEDWWRALVKLTRTVCADPETASRVAALSLSTQGGTLVPVGPDMAPLRPAIVWSDGRCGEERDLYAQTHGPRTMYEKTGWSLSNGLPAMEAAWLRRHEPDVFARTAMYLTVPDFLSYRLTGRAAVDISNAGINQFADIRRGAYDDALCAFAGVRREQLPEILPSGKVIGPLTSGAARLLGLPERAVLVSGAHDQYAVAAGAGLTRKGSALIGSGTAWVITALTDAPAFGTGVAQSISATPGKWGSMVTLTGGSCLEWFRTRLTDGGEPLPFGVIDARAGERPPGANGLFFYPYLGGGTYPNRDPALRASLQGLGFSHDRYDIARAIMEGVAFQTAWALEHFRRHFPVDTLKLTGGAAKSALWSQIVADVMGLPIRVPQMPELACVGACILAGVGSGVFPGMDEGYARLAVEERVLEPDPVQSPVYQGLLDRYKKRILSISSKQAADIAN